MRARPNTQPGLRPFVGGLPRLLTGETFVELFILEFARTRPFKKTGIKPA